MPVDVRRDETLAAKPPHMLAEDVARLGAELDLGWHIWR
jgi:hypothetical protein